MNGSWLLLASFLAAPAPADTLVVCPPALRGELQPWLVYRERQGHRVQVIAPAATARETQLQIRAAARSGALRSVLLIGDAVADPRTPSAVVPTHLLPAKVNVHWGSEPELASDNPFADLDDDRIPDLAIGRLTADTPEQLKRMVEKILAYERQPMTQDWAQRINFVAGVGGFNPLLDSILETTTRRFLTDGVPASFDPCMTYGSWRSPFCPDPREFHNTVLQRFNEGCLFWVYIGHGHPRGLDRVNTPAGAFHIFDNRDVSQLKCTQGQPIAIFLACYTGAFDLPQDCLAEDFLRSEGGPVAVLSGSRVTMPYAMAVLGDGLMRAYFQDQRKTLGEVVLHAKRELARTLPADDPQPAGLQRRLLDSLAAAISPDKQLLEEERLEHVQLFNLLGDPLLRLPQPTLFALNAPTTVDAGELLQLTAEAPLAGECTFELVCRHDGSKVPAPVRDRFIPSDQWLSDFNEDYDRARDRRWTVLHQNSTDKQLAAELPVPREASGPCHVRVRVRDGQHVALGVANVFVRTAARRSAR